jgi:hypothetical protein
VALQQAASSGDVTLPQREQGKMGADGWAAPHSAISILFKYFPNRFNF